MILPDVNTLVYAFHRDTKEHEPAPQIRAYSYAQCIGKSLIATIC